MHQLYLTSSSCQSVLVVMLDGVVLAKQAFIYRIPCECGKAYIQLQTTVIHVCSNAGEIELHSRGLLARKLVLMNFVRSKAPFSPLSLILSFPLGEGAYPEKQLVIGPVFI